MHVHTKLKQMYVKWHVLLERKGDLGANRVVDHNRSYILHSGAWGTYDPLQLGSVCSLDFISGKNCHKNAVQVTGSVSSLNIQSVFLKGQYNSGVSEGLGVRVSRIFPSTQFVSYCNPVHCNHGSFMYNLSMYTS